MAELVLKVEDIKGYYKGSFGTVHAVDGVTFDIYKGDILAIAGESGCGKSSLAELLTGSPMPMLHYESGQVTVNEIPIYIPKPEDKSKLGKWRKEQEKLSNQTRKDVLCKIIGYVPQSSQDSLNPVKKIRKFILDVMKQRVGTKPKKQIKRSKEDIKYDTLDGQKVRINFKEEVLTRVREHLEKLGLSGDVLGRYPHELSGGMKQRIVIGISTLWNPLILIADEPTSALDVTTQKILIETFMHLREMGIVETIVYISHDIPTLAQICNKCIVMYAGKLVEFNSMDNIIHSPLHPYSQGLIHSIASFNPDGSAETDLNSIPGRPPNLRDPPEGCRFYDRCNQRMDICKEEYPPFFSPNGNDSSRVACWLYKK
ncbi:MAG: ABC transporter ATP-binding protein [Candidatus Lokiarchaeota archaeon]|nr:ABC transporter ATP-binding protein [Candidatus Lokiarchaeota archaeon]